MFSTVQQIVVEGEDVENKLRSGTLKKRLLNESLFYGSIELFLTCLNLTAIGWGEFEPFRA